MVEIEIGILSQQVLKKRLADQQTLRHETAVWRTQRNRQRRTIHWRFTKEDARRALKYDPTELRSWSSSILRETESLRRRSAAVGDESATTKASAFPPESVNQQWSFVSHGISSFAS